MAVKRVPTKTRRKPKGKEKDFLAIARQKVTRPKLIESYPKFLIYSRNKKGKTKFGLSAGIENTLVIDPEHGTDRFRTLNPYVWHMTRWEDMAEIYGALRTGELSPKILGKGSSTAPFTWVLVDGMTKINNMALKFVQRKSEEASLTQQPGFVDRRYYNKSGELMKEMLTQFHTLPMGVIYTAQEKMKVMATGDVEMDEDDEGLFITPDIPDAVRGAANSIVDLIGRLYVTKVNLKSGDTKAQRRLWIGVHDRYDTGFRSDYELPDFIKNPTVPKLVNLIHTGNEKGEAA